MPKNKFHLPLKTPEQLKQERENRNKRRARIIVRNLSFKTTEASLREYFSKFGDLQEVTLLKRPDGRLVGCAFLQYEKVTQAAKALLYTGREWLGRVIHIDWAINKDTYTKHQNKIKQQNASAPTAEVSEENVANGNNEDNASIKSELLSEAEEDNESKADDDEDKENSSNVDEDEEKDVKLDIKNEIEEKKSVRISNDLVEGCTVFIKNVPFDATNLDLKRCCQQFGPLYYGLINTDPVSGHAKGTAFVKYRVSYPPPPFIRKRFHK